MKILGIETSCDDTGIAVLEISEGDSPQFRILSNVVASQIDVHQEYGGVFPSLAKREHQKNLPIVLEQAIAFASSPHPRPARTSLEQLPFPAKIDAIAVTHGPGLSPCLWTGINFAKELAQKWNVPLIPVDHIEGHLLVALLQNIQDTKYQILNTQNTFPAVALIVSGGHTQLLLVKAIGEYEIIGETRDDAAGEVFDKTARILGLPYPGGPEIAAQAESFKTQNLPYGESHPRQSKFKISLPRPMLHTKDFDFSFSGLKTAVLYDSKARPEQERQSKEYVQEMAAEIQQAIIDVLMHKTINAAKELGAQSIILGGGVSANDELRLQLSQKASDLGIELLAPPKNLSTDNGLMIALAGYFAFKKGNVFKKEDEFEKLEACPNLRLA